VKRFGVFGLILGSLIGVLATIILALILRPVPPPTTIQPPIISPDVTIFISERSLSRLASETLRRPTIVDFDSNGLMQVTTRVKFGPLEPMIHLGLILEMQGADLVSELSWIKVGFLTTPARWSPQVLREGSQMVGQLIKNQTPPDFVLVGLTTTPEGLIFQLNWIGE
jgi:hypothetical protein